MSYGGIQMLMEKLNQLINCNDIPLFNHPSVICERPQLQLLYDELGSMIQTIFIYQHQDLHDLEKLNDLKKRFIYAAEEAEYIVDAFVSRVHITKNGLFPTLGNNGSFIISVAFNLQDVKISLKSIKVEFMEMDSSPRPETTLHQPVAAPISSSRSSLGSKKLMDDIFVGLDIDAELIRVKLVEDQRKLEVVSIVGMGGIGKTTLATKVYNDDYVKYHFDVRVWVTVSQTYDKRDVLIQILESICAELNLENANDSRLRELVHKNLMGKRYLIVIDDIWHVETWDKLKVFFPHDNTGSRILLTSRLTEVAKHASSDGLIHHLKYLNKERSWELLCHKVFQGNGCPEWLIKPGMQIVENCKGLPLAVVVIAGILAKETRSEAFWVEIAKKTGSYIVGEQNGCLETLALSYNHLPHHLKECFLYLGGFPEDYKFKVQRLICLWVAEGFIQQDGNRSLEDIAEGYLMDLIDRNLVIVADRSKCDGAVKACKVHDLVRELCLRKASEERFILITERLMLSPQFSDVITQAYKPVRMFTYEDINMLGFRYLTALNLRSILCYSKFGSLSNDMVKCFHSFVLLRVLDLQRCILNDFPKGMESLVHLRYLAICKVTEGFPSSICNLWNLQTLIYNTQQSSRVVLPSKISDLANLRHLWSCYHSNWYGKNEIVLPSFERPMKLQTISDVMLADGAYDFQKYFPYIKELACRIYLEKEIDFRSLVYLEKLKLTSNGTRMNNMAFPATLKTLTLAECRLPWSDMSIIQSLPNLHVLKLHKRAFQGSCWNTDEQEFPQLKFLRLEWLDIDLWEAYSSSFPCLRQLEIKSCYNLEEIPLEIGEIPTLDLIQIEECRHSVGESVRTIEKEQHDSGNYDLKLIIIEDCRTQLSQRWARWI